MVNKTSDWVMFYITQWSIYTAQLINPMADRFIINVINTMFQLGEFTVGKEEKILKEVEKKLKNLEKTQKFALCRNDKRIARKLIELLTESCDYALHKMEEASNYGKIGARTRWGSEDSSYGPPNGAPITPPNGPPIRAPNAYKIRKEKIRKDKKRISFSISDSEKLKMFIKAWKEVKGEEILGDSFDGNKEFIVCSFVGLCADHEDLIQELKSAPNSLNDFLDWAFKERIVVK